MLIVLVATVPERKKLCEHILVELTKQKRPPDGIVLVCDGYADKETLPRIPEKLQVKGLVRSPELRGCGARWEAVRALDPLDIVTCIDDDTMVTRPYALERLAARVQPGKVAAGSMGVTVRGRIAPPGDLPFGQLIFAAACGLTFAAGDLQGLWDFADEVKRNGGPAALEKNGNDDALISAYFWKRGITIQHAATGNFMPLARSVNRGPISHAQKWQLAKITGWPFNSQHHGKPPVPPRQARAR